MPKILFIGLNPSVANAEKNDATTNKVISFAKRNGHGGVVLGNCFPCIATNPKNLIDFTNLEKNDHWLKSVRTSVTEIVFAWGNFTVVSQIKRDLEMHKIFPQAKILAKNKNGSPKHPLYAKLDLGFQKFHPLPSSKNHL